MSISGKSIESPGSSAQGTDDQKVACHARERVSTLFCTETATEDLLQSCFGGGAAPVVGRPTYTLYAS